MPSGDIHNASGACWCGLDHWFGQWQAGYNVGYREAQEDIAGAAPQPDAGSLRDAISALPRYSPVDTGDLIGGMAERPLGGWVQRSAVLDALAAAPRDTVTVERLARPNWSVAPGEVLREWFTERGITQSEVAARMGVAPPEVSKLVNGHDRITPRQALALERACGINADVLARMQVDYDLHALRALGESPNPTTEDAP